MILLHPGADEIIRVVSIKEGGNITKRAVTKFCVLPIDAVQLMWLLISISVSVEVLSKTLKNFQGRQELRTYCV